MKIKNAKLAEAFMKLMTDMGATFVDATPKKKKSPSSGSDSKKLFASYKKIEKKISL